MLKRARLMAFVTVVSAPLALGAPVFGAQCLEVKVPDSVKAGGTDLVLNGLLASNVVELARIGGHDPSADDFRYQVLRDRTTERVERRAPEESSGRCAEAGRQ